MEKKLKCTREFFYSAKQVAPDVYEKKRELYFEMCEYAPNGDLEMMSHDCCECSEASHVVHFKDGKPIDHRFRCEHDELGRIVTEIMATGNDYDQVTRYQYNDDGSRVERCFLSNNDQEISRKEYDVQGNLVFASNEPNEYTGYCIHTESFYIYDENNRLVYEEGIDDYAREYKVSYILDESGKCVKILRVQVPESYYLEEEPAEFDEAILEYEVTEHIHNANGTIDTNVYTCQATSVDEFFAGNYSKEIRETYVAHLEEAIEGDHKIKTFKYYQNDQLKAIEVVTFGLDNDDAPLSCIRTDINDLDEYEDIEECNITETFFEYWD